MSVRGDGESAVATNASPGEGPLQIDYDVKVVAGEQGQRLAILQAEAVLDVLTWLHEHRHARHTDE